MKALAVFVGTVVTFAAFAPSALGGLTDAAPMDAAQPLSQTLPQVPSAPLPDVSAPDPSAVSSAVDPAVENAMQTVQNATAPVTAAAAPVAQAAANVTAPVTTAAAPIVETVTKTAATVIPSATVVANTVVANTAAPVTKLVTPVAATADRLAPTARRRDEATTVKSPVATAASDSTDSATSTSVAATAGHGRTAAAAAAAVTRQAQQPAGTVLPASAADMLIAPSPTDTHSTQSPAAGDSRAQASDSSLPGVPLRDTIPGLAGTLSAAASSSSVAFFAALLTLFIIASPSVGRWLRPALDVFRPSGFVSPIEVPG